MLAEVRQLRGDLTLVAMSATLDAPRFAALIGDTLIGAAADGNHDGGGPAPVIDCPSALFPLDVEWAPASAPRLDERGVARAFLDHVADTAAASHAAALAGGRDMDALVFVPGAWEVSYVAAPAARPERAPRFWNSTARRPAEQDRAVSGREPGGAARIIVSTALAESSLTVPGVRLVIDSGLSREPRRDAGRGMSGLVTVSCSRASAEQRAGRAARQGPGTVIRCYDQKAFGAAPAHPTPEIAVADLTGAALVLACWGAPGGRGLALPDAPPRAAMDEAVEVLRELGAVSRGRSRHRSGQDPGPGPDRPPAGPRPAGRRRDGGLPHGGGGRRPGRPGTSAHRAQTSPACWPRCGRAGIPDPGAGRRTSGGWSRSPARNPPVAGTRSHPRRAVASAAVGAAEAVGFVVALAFPDRVARRVPGEGPARYLLTSGTRAGLPAGSPLSGHEWLAVAEVSRAQGRDAAGTGAVIRSAAPLTADTAEAAARQPPERHRCRRGSARAGSRPGGSAAWARSCSRPPRYGLLRRRAAQLWPAHWPSEGLANHRMVDGGGRLAPPSCPAAPGAGRSHGPTFPSRRCWPGFDDWLAPELAALAGGASTGGIDLAGPLSRLLPWPEAARLGELAPESLAVPSGSRIRIDYPDAGRRHRPAGSGRQAAGVLWLGRDAAAGRRARAGAVPPALAGPPAPGRDGRPRFLLVRALRPGPGRNARPLSAASVAGRPVDRARDSPDQAAELTPDQQPGAAN